MSVFETFGVKHLSASALNKWQGCRGAWVAHYLFDIKGQVGPAAWRGTAVEAGLTAALVGTGNVDPLQQAMMAFENEAQGDADDAVDKQRELIPPFVEQAIAGWKEAGLDKPVTQQVRTELWFDGLDVPIIGYADFVMEGYTVDLKTTERLPSKPSYNHTLQAAGYASARGEDSACLFYVTPKKSALYRLTAEDIASANRDMRRTAIGLQASLRAALYACDGDLSRAKATMAKMSPPNPDSFYWDDGSLAEALAIVQAWT